MTELWELPRGWRWATMGEIAKVVGGSTPKTSDPSYWGGNIPWITPDDLSGFTHKYIQRGRRSITQAGYDSCSTQMVPAGTVLFTSRAPIGYVAIAAEPVCTNQGFKSFVCSPEVLPDYMYWWLKASRGLAAGLASGTTFLELSGKAAARLPVPVPPGKIQRGIVAALEQQMTQLEAGLLAIAAARRRLTSHRRAVLHAATTGFLPASRNGSSWQSALLADATDPSRPICYGILKPRTAAPGVVPYVEVRDLRQAILRADRLNRTTEELDRQFARSRLRAGDVLVAIRGSYERIGLVPPDLEGANISRDVARVSPREGVDPRYLVLLLRSPIAQQYFRSVARGVAVKGVNIGDLRRTPIRLPPLALQQEIVNEADRALSVIDELEVELERSSVRAERLRQAISRAAFAGKLTPKGMHAD